MVIGPTPRGTGVIATNPPPFAELQVVLVRALSKPILVRGSGPVTLPPST
jgi:hypothetical protein